MLCFQIDESDLVVSRWVLRQQGGNTASDCSAESGILTELLQLLFLLFLEMAISQLPQLFRNFVKHIIRMLILIFKLITNLSTSLLSLMNEDVESSKS